MLKLSPWIDEIEKLLGLNIQDNTTLGSSQDQHIVKMNHQAHVMKRETKTKTK